MRDQLDEALRHQNDGYGRAQHANKVELPKRFYTDVGVAPVEGGFALTLDGRGARTPAQRIPVVLPAVAIATAMASEWSAQGEFIDARTMPMTRLVNSAIESGTATMPLLREEIIKFAGNDLLLYRADAPPSLVAEQEAVWDQALVALARRFNVAFQPTIGILHQPQPPKTLDRLVETLVDESLFALTALVSITGITGSGLLAIGLRQQLFTPDHVWTAAHLDEDFQITQWGADDEATARRIWRRTEFDVAVAMLSALPV